MAWDAYTKRMTESGLHLSGIYGLDGNVWSQSESMKATQPEISAIIAGIKAQNFPNGVYIGGVKYTVIRLFPDTVTAKCRNAATDTENYLLHCSLAATCIIVGAMSGPNERDTTKHVDDVRDYLVKCNY
jgi:hypothetical protein